MYQFLVLFQIQQFFCRYEIREQLNSVMSNNVFKENFSNHFAQIQKEKIDNQPSCARLFNFLYITFMTDTRYL